MKNKFYLILMIFLVSACGKSSEEIVPNYQGGKGGNFNLAVFPVKGKKGVSGKVYIKYATLTPIGSLNQADDSVATMVEPGVGPHSHFFGLKTGYYAIKAICSDSNGTYSNDTCIEIRGTQSVNTDFTVQVR